MRRGDVELFTLAQARRISGNPDAALEHHVYRDLGIDGFDAIELYENIEKEFGVSIRPVTEKSVDVPVDWFRKERSRTVPRDPTLQQIVDFLISGYLESR